MLTRRSSLRLAGGSSGGATCRASRCPGSPAVRWLVPLATAALASLAAWAQPESGTWTLDDVIERALAANRGLAEARDGAERSRLSVTVADAEFELKLFPDVDVGASEEDEDVGAGLALQKKFSFGTETRIAPTVQRIAGTYSAAVAATVVQPLLRGRTRDFNRNAVWTAEFADRSAERALYLARVATVLDAVRAAYAVVRQNELVELHEDAAARLRGHAEGARAKQKAGLASAIDVYRATIELKQAEDDLSLARESLGDALDELKLILALPLEHPIAVDAPLACETVELTEHEAVAVALANRMEQEQTADEVREAQRQSRVARHNTLPDLGLFASWSRFGSGTDLGGTALDRETWRIGLQSRTGATRTVERAAYAQSLIVVSASRRRRELQRDRIVREVKAELRNLARSEQRTLLQREKGEQARGQLELARVKFRHGLAGNFDLIDAETALRRSQVALLSARIDYILGTYRLRGALGTLLDRGGGS